MKKMATKISSAGNKITPFIRRSADEAKKTEEYKINFSFPPRKNFTRQKNPNIIKSEKMISVFNNLPV